MIIEILYTYQEDKHSEIQNSFTYFHSKSEDLTKSVSEAGKYFKRFLRENGWTKQVKLKSIQSITNESSPVSVVTITEPKPTKKRKRTPKK